MVAGITPTTRAACSGVGPVCSTTGRGGGDGCRGGGCNGATVGNSTCRCPQKHRRRPLCAPLTPHGQRTRGRRLDVFRAILLGFPVRFRERGAPMPGATCRGRGQPLAGGGGVAHPWVSCNGATVGGPSGTNSAREVPGRDPLCYLCLVVSGLFVLSNTPMTCWAMGWGWCSDKPKSAKQSQ